MSGERKRERGRGEGKSGVLRGMCVRVCCRAKQPGGLTLRLKKSASGKLLLPLFCSRLLLPLPPSQDVAILNKDSVSREEIIRNRSIENCWISVNGERCVGQRLSIRLYHGTALIVLDVDVILDDSSKRRNGNTYTFASSEKFNFLSSFPPRETVFENGDLTR